ncbi:hypothetical protein GGS23DRAFT_548394 [Durotheca rogersii]|uniref:uncharacterized protein n=1 Tax=Durotheca rogersii TaxID=419775 RepID=UPI00221F627C|nr:uncharacterized protein GGS23DRAFT_548394 [Durotheca rogersii]KAI5867433.1 hypothetical protein GGS23DRAFT_548394 [Durotheca rogersii]
MKKVPPRAKRKVQTGKDTRDQKPRKSNKIFILGIDRHAKLLAHSLAAVPGLPPTQILAHDMLAMTKWGEEGRSIDIRDFNGKFLSSRKIRCPEYIGHRRVRSRFLSNLSPMTNIVVSTATRAVIPTLYSLRYYIDRHTTVCLVHPGLGVMEALNEEVFTNPALRPNYVLCHSIHKLGQHSSDYYSLKHAPGRMFLYGMPRDDGGGADIPLRVATSLSYGHTQHLIALLAAAEELGAVNLPRHLFLQQKLPMMIFSSLLDTISVILGCRFDHIRHDEHAMHLWENMLRETLAIVSALPEFHDFPEIVEWFNRPRFAGYLKGKLTSRRYVSGYSEWISLVRRGFEPPVDFLNGYFVRRARELGLSCHYNTMSVFMVKARLNSRRRELNLGIPLGLQPYTMDDDKIGGGQDVFDPKLDGDLDA